MPSPALLTRRALLSTAALAALALPRLGRAETRPDLVFIFADDLRHDAMGWAGDPLARTPNIGNKSPETLPPGRFSGRAPSELRLIAS